MNHKIDLKLIGNMKYKHRDGWATLMLCCFTVPGTPLGQSWTDLVESARSVQSQVTTALLVIAAALLPPMSHIVVGEGPNIYLLQTTISLTLTIPNEYLSTCYTLTQWLFHCYMHACISGQIKSLLLSLSNITNYFFLDNITASDEGEEWLLSPIKTG